MKEKIEFLNQLGNKIGKKATETYKATKEKAVNLSEEIKYKTKISSLQDQNFEIFAEIGEIVYNELSVGKDVSREAVLMKCDLITRNKKEIESLQASIDELKKDNDEPNNNSEQNDNKESNE